MKFTPFAVLIFLGAGSVLAEDTGIRPDPAAIPAEVAANAIALRERALEDNLSVDIVESVTTEVGARRMGTEGDRRVIAWAQAKFEELGFDRAWTEPVELDRGWERGEARAAVLEPFAHDIVITGDIPLASRCLKQNAAALGLKGRPFTEDNIGGAVAMRDLLTDLRASGEKTRGPAPFAKSDRSRFLQELDKMIHALRRQA